MGNLLKTIKFTFKLLYKSSGLLILIYLILNLLCSIFPIANAYIFKEILNRLTLPQTSLQNLIFFICAYIASLVAVQAAGSSMRLCYSSIMQRAEKEYSVSVSSKLNELPMSFVDTNHGKNLIDDVNHIKNAVINFPNYVVQSVSALATFIISFSSIAAFNLFFSIVFILLSIPGLLFQYYFRTRADKLRRKNAPDVRKFSYYRWILTDSWPAKDVRTYDLTEPMKKRYDDEKKEYRKSNKILDRKKLYMSLLSEFIMRSGEIIFSAYVVLKAFSGVIGIGDATLYISLALSAAAAFENLAGTVLFGITRTVQNMKYAFEFFGQTGAENQQNKQNSRKLESFESLTFDNVYFKYPFSDEYVLKGISFSLHRGDRLSIVGVNGAGKSTIIKLMIGLYEVEQGQILINGFPMNSYDLKDVHGLFSVLFQNFVQYPLTMRENVALSDIERMEDDEQIKEALMQSGGYGDLTSKLKDGLDSIMTRQFDDNGTELSKGQWQKIALSRAYFKNSPIIIFDEPSAALDAEAEDKIFENFKNISSGRTGIMITHRISAARMSSKLIVIDGGKIIEQGTHEELVSLGGTYAKLYNLQREKYIVKGG